MGKRASGSVHPASWRPPNLAGGAAPSSGQEHCPVGPPTPTLCRLPGSPSALPEALGADARVAIDRVHTLGPMAAPVGGAVIIVHLAELPAVARGAFAPATRQSEAAPGPASFQAASPVSPCVLKAPQPPRAPQSPATACESVSAWFTQAP